MQLTHTQQRAADIVTQCYQTLGESNVVRELFTAQEEVFFWQHYPTGDVKDNRHHSQYFYHAHPSKDMDRVPEHGHFHIFSKQPRVAKGERYIVASDKFLKSDGRQDNLTHLVAIAMNELGRPTALFTVNYWVVLGLWYPAETLIPLLDDFVVDIPKSLLATTNTWVSSMVKLFKPYIIELLLKRDEVIHAHQQVNSQCDVYYDKQLEVTSVLSLP
jgi:Domain of unknown function (DUF6969)